MHVLDREWAGTDRLCSVYPDSGFAEYTVFILSQFLTEYFHRNQEILLQKFMAMVIFFCMIQLYCLLELKRNRAEQQNDLSLITVFVLP